MYLINLTIAVKRKCLNSTTEAMDFWGFVFHYCLSHAQIQCILIEQNAVNELMKIKKLSRNDKPS